MNLTRYKEFYEKHGDEIVSYANELEKLDEIPNKYMIYF